MSEKEKEILKTMAEALPEMSDMKKRRISRIRQSDGRFQESSGETGERRRRGAVKCLNFQSLS